jgi:hypothetical protein
MPTQQANNSNSMTIEWNQEKTTATRTTTNYNTDRLIGDIGTIIDLTNQPQKLL